MVLLILEGILTFYCKEEIIRRYECLSFKKNVIDIFIKLYLTLINSEINLKFFLIFITLNL